MQHPKGRGDHSKRELVLTPETAVEAEQSGACEVEGNRIRALIEPQKTGNYTLEITYELPPETRKVRVMVDVH